MIKLDKDRIRYIALNRFFNVYHESVYDCWSDALEVWLGENKYKIVTLEEYAIIEAKRHQEMSKTFKEAPAEVVGEALTDPDEQK